MSALAKLFSKLAKEIEGAPIKKATPQEWSNYLRNRGVKQEELENFENRAIKDANYPADRPMTKEEAAEQFRVLGDVPLRETRLARWNSLTPDEQYEAFRSEAKHLDPKYGSEYSLAGAPEDAYEELVLHSPLAQKLFSDSQHYTDVPGGDQNIAWLRYHLRSLEPEGSELISNAKRSKLFHLDEIQSKRHQQAELKNKKTDIKHGYYDRAEKEKNAAEYQKLNELRSKVNSDQEQDELTNRMRQLSGDFNLMNSPDMTIGPQPDAPFKGDTWKNLGLRRALLEAAERDADLFSWTTGKMQQQRWSDNAGQGTERFYDKYIPNQLMKDLKDHGLTDDAFVQIDDPSRAFDVRELPQSLASLISSANDSPDIGHVAGLVNAFEDNSNYIIQQFRNAGMPASQIHRAVGDLFNFQQQRKAFIDDPDLDMEKVLDFGHEFVPKYLTNLNLQTAKLPAVRLTPEVRKSILEKGFPKYMLPLGGIGLTDEMLDEQEPEEYASGGLVKAGKKALQELLENMKVKDPERLKRAEEAGFDTSKVWLHGTNTDELVNEGAFLKPENWFTDNPDVASIYAQRNPYDLEISPNIVPTFIRNAEGKYKFYPKADDPYVNIEVLRRNRGDIRSIFNDFTPESLADEKFAHGGLVRSYPYD